MTTRIRRRVTATRGLEKNLSQLEGFLESIGASHRYDELITDLFEQTVPLLERMPRLGPRFPLERLPDETKLLVERIVAKLEGGELRQLVRGDFLLLYLANEGGVHLLAIRHHREATFSFGRST